MGRKIFSYRLVARWAVATATCVAVAPHVPGLAQTSRGSVVGIVTDSSGAVVPVAKVELTHTATGVTRSTVTNENGIYRFEVVDLGIYSLKVSKPGFKVFLSTALGVQANRTTTLDAMLAVGDSQSVIDVNAGSAELLTRDGPLRAGNLGPQEVSRLPLAALNPISLARTLPGVSQTEGTVTFGMGEKATQFSVNGQRPRGNNYLLDGVDNNNIVFTGTAERFIIADAVEELSVQTSNFGTEFGRAGGGIFNVITKAGTNSYHGTAFWQYGSQDFNSVSNLDKLNRAPQSVFSQNVYGFTLGGPVRQNKTFFFGALQQDSFHSIRQYPIVASTADSVGRLRALFPSNPGLDLYLNALGNLRGSTNTFPLALGADPLTGIDRGVVVFGTTPVGVPLTNEGPEWIARLDHNLSEAHQLSFRYIYDSRMASPDNISANFAGFYFPGYISDRREQSQNFLFSDRYTIHSTWTNEFHFSYGRTGVDFLISPRSVPLAGTLPTISIPNINMPGMVQGIPQFYVFNNWLVQEIHSKLAGRHTFRYGLEFLRQLAKQRGAGFVGNGVISYTDAIGYSGFANFLDDFSGPSGVAIRTFGDPVFYPNMFRQAYFFQDTWKARPSLTLTVGLRYENFGQPANVFKSPAFAGFDPAQFLVPNKVNRDDNNFGPAVGLAWSPSFHSHLLYGLFGDGKTVWRAGFQVSYDAFYTQLLNFLSGDSPNVMRGQINAPNVGRGLPSWFARLPMVAAPPSILDAQQGVFDKNLRNPYTERWSLGIQRELPRKVLVDLSYIGSESHKLFTRDDLNPRLLDGVRVHPNFGIRQVLTSEGNAVYHGLQLRVDRRFADGFQVNGSYTWSRSIDSTSEGVPLNISSNPGNLTSVPISFGGLKLDRGSSDYDRAHRFTVVYLWDIPGPKHGIKNQAFGGWSITGVTMFQSGTPFTVLNGFDRNNDGLATDRPDIGNPNAPVNTRAILSSSCSSGYQDPDKGVCVSPADVHFIQAGRSLPGPRTVGRNTLFTAGINNWDANLAKTVVLAETKKLEIRWEAFNVFNHPQFVNVPERNVLSSPPGRFLNLAFTNGGIRTMQLELKLIF